MRGRHWKPHAQLKALYAQVPPVEGCIPGCTDCCGPVPFSRIEWESIRHKQLSSLMKCGFACDLGCKIYPQRPFLCRLFGAVDDDRLRCPHGARAQEPLSVEMAQELSRIYGELMRGGA